MRYTQIMDFRQYIVQEAIQKFKTPLAFLAAYVRIQIELSLLRSRTHTRFVDIVDLGILMNLGLSNVSF